MESSENSSPTIYRKGDLVDRKMEEFLDTMSQEEIEELEDETPISGKGQDQLSISENYLIMSSEDDNQSTPAIVSMTKDVVKLYVGQIPKHITEDELLAVFSKYGNVVELTIVRDTVTRVCKGFGFISYLDPLEAATALEALNGRVSLEGAGGAPLIIKYAIVQEKDYKVFVGMLPKSFTETEISALFGTFGTLNEVHLMRNEMGVSKHCAFVKFIDRSSAERAIQELNESIPLGATRKLVVKFADGRGKEAPQQPPRPIYHTYPYPSNNEWIMTSNMEEVPTFLPHMYPIQPPYSAPYIAVPTSVVHQPNSRNPRRANSTNRYGGVINSAPQNNFVVVDENHSSLPNPESHNNRPPEGPMGANLFVYHLPRDITNADLATLFAHFGNVISAKVFVDRQTSGSRGFGFVSYDSCDAAAAAIEGMNGFQVGPKRLKVEHKRHGENPNPRRTSSATHNLPHNVNMLPQNVHQQTVSPHMYMGRNSPMTNVPSQPNSVYPNLAYPVVLPAGHYYSSGHYQYGSPGSSGSPVYPPPPDNTGGGGGFNMV